MLFRRRQPVGLWERFRVWLWPRRSFSRSGQYFAKRVLRVPATPHAIAAGVAAGVFASCTPLIGFHFILGFLLALIIGGNLIAAALGTAFANPLTIPVIWAASYELGQLMRGGHIDDGGRNVDLVSLIRDFELWQLWQPVLKPMMIGALPLGLGFGLLFYGITYWTVSVVQSRRRERLLRRACARQDMGGATV